jgi:phosphoglycerol transferase MdoB-like AlkP superfamily enzyme
MKLLPIGNHRLKLWCVIGFVLFVMSLFTRIILLIISNNYLDFTFVNLTGIFLIGFLFDLANVFYFTIPFVLYLWLTPDRIFNKPRHRFVVYSWFFLMTAVLIFNAVAELLFWDEFNVRFNFIAVDYLVYTTEVVGNITQSYPIGWIVAGIVLSVVAITYLISKHLRAPIQNFPFKQRSKLALVYCILFTLCYFLIQTDYHKFSKNSYANELAGNGMYELFAAYLNNELDYGQFYKTMNNDEAFSVVHRMLDTREATWLDAKFTRLDRKISNAGQEKRLNVVLISVESFSADFMTSFGNTKHVTPFLDSLSKHSLLFTNLYATGTRTVRGLEALSLCVPPTPGQSIIRRPHNEHLFSLAKVFQDKGYECEYIYGGYGYFDNMNYFFSNNGYDVVDRTALLSDEIHYENIWGVADEDLFTLAEKQIDLTVKKRPVFAHVMTTSNHRPFTYPEGRIDIPSHTGRDGAVKYTDYSIGRFINNCAKKDWFQNTIFVIVADHCASSAGKTELPVNKYHIPMLIYSPGNVQPGVMTRLMSQIDVGPTMLGMLNFSYTSKFFGSDIFKVAPGEERAFISTYQSLGYLKKGKLVVLSPQQKVTAYELSETFEPVKIVKDEKLEREAVAWYQSASYSFKQGLMDWEERQSKLE